MASKNAHEESDESLMQRVCEGDHRAFSTLVERHSGLFYQAAFRMSARKDDAEDIVQEAFLKLWKRPDAFDANKGAKFTTWFYRVVTNLAIDKTRKKRPYSASDILDVFADEGEGADEKMMVGEEEAALEAAIQNLPDRQKAALNLCFYEGLSNKEAAETLGVGIKALESLLMRAKAKLKEEMIVLGHLELEDSKKAS